MDAKTTGHFIAELRKQHGLTQKELADRLMVTDKAVSRWETGKGLPDTSLLKPLAELLGVSVGELLAGRMIEEAQMKDQTDRIILDSLRYSGRMFARMVNLVLILLGAALLVSPLFTAGRNHHWVEGLVLIGIAALRIHLRKRGKTMKLNDRALYGTGIVLQLAALILELLPYGAVLIFAPGPTERVTELYSYFQLELVGYGNFAPFLTGALTIAVILLGIIAFCRYEKARKCKNAAFVCTVIAAALSLVPLLLFGRAYMTTTSYLITALLAASVCCQAVANRKDIPGT